MKDGDYMMPKNWIPGYKGKYFATIEGQIFRVYKNGRTRELKGYKKRNPYCTTINAIKVSPFPCSAGCFHRTDDTANADFQT